MNDRRSNPRAGANHDQRYLRQRHSSMDEITDYNQNLEGGASNYQRRQALPDKKAGLKKNFSGNRLRNDPADKYQTT